MVVNSVSSILNSQLFAIIKPNEKNLWGKNWVISNIEGAAVNHHLQVVPPKPKNAKKWHYKSSIV